MPPNALSGERRLDRLTFLTVATAGLLSLAFAFVMPPFQFNDEHSHFLRSYQLSRGQFVGRADPVAPAAVLGTVLSYPEGFPWKTAPWTSAQDLFAGGGESSPAVLVGNSGKLRFLDHGILSCQLYWSGSYLPAAAGIRVARLFNVSPVAMLYAARIMNVLCFMAALWAALCLAPGFRALITAVAFLPMTLQQAAAVSADQMTISLSLAGFALILYSREHPVSRRYLATLLVVVPLWVLCKTSLWALPLLLLIPASQFRSHRSRAVYLATVTLIAIAAVAAWRVIDSGAFAQFAAEELAHGVDVNANTRLLLTHPLAVLNDLTFFRRFMINEFVGVFGWEFHTIRLSFAEFFVLLAIASIELNPKPFKIAERMILFLVFAAGIIVIYAALFAISGTYRDGHYGMWAAGVQGRYCIPFCLAGLLTMKQNVVTVPSAILAPVVLFASTSYALLALATVTRFFYR
jgi:uncharacterized membrane protein